MVSLPEGLTWATGESSHMFVRSCWRDLADIVEKMFLERRPFAGMVLTGNPGIGKSWFLSYMMWRASKLGQIVVLESVQADVVWVLRPDGHTRRVQVQHRNDIPELQESSTLYLLDPAGHRTPREPVMSDAFTLVAASPNRAHYQQFLKRVQHKRFFPTWMLAELLAVRKFVEPSLEESELRRRFEVFGGISRAVFSRNILEMELQLDGAIATCHMVQIQDSLGCQDTAPQASHQLLQYDVDPDASPPFSSVTTRFASGYVERKFTQRVAQVEIRDVWSLVSATAGEPRVAAVRGSAFEALAMRLLRMGGQFRVRRLSDSQEFKLHVPALEEKSIGSTSDVAQHGTPTSLLRPKNPNFPVVDAFASGLRLAGDSPPKLSSVVGLQMTVSDRHPIVRASFNKHLDGLSSSTLDLFYVVPSEVFEQFGSQPYVDKNRRRVKPPNPEAVQWALELKEREYSR